MKFTYQRVAVGALASAVALLSLFAPGVGAQAATGPAITVKVTPGGAMGGGQPALTLAQFAHMLNNTPDVFINDLDYTDTDVTEYPEIAVQAYVQHNKYDDATDPCVVSSGIQAAVSGLVTVKNLYDFKAIGNTWSLTTLLAKSPEAAKTLGTALAAYNTCHYTEVGPKNVKPYNYSGGKDGVLMWSQGFAESDCWSTTPLTPDEKYWMAGCDNTIASAQYGNVIIEISGKTDSIWADWKTAAMTLKTAVDRTMVGQVIPLTLTVTNTGDTPLSNITFSYGDPYGASGPKPAVTCPLDTLAPGQSMDCTASYTLLRGDADRGYTYIDFVVSGEAPKAQTVKSDAAWGALPAAAWENTGGKDPGTGTGNGNGNGTGTGSGSTSKTPNLNAPTGGAAASPASAVPVALGLLALLAGAVIMVAVRRRTRA